MLAIQIIMKAITTKNNTRHLFFDQVVHFQLGFALAGPRVFLWKSIKQRLVNDIAVSFRLYFEIYASISNLKGDMPIILRRIFINAWLQWKCQQIGIITKIPHSLSANIRKITFFLAGSPQVRTTAKSTLSFFLSLLLCLGWRDGFCFCLSPLTLTPAPSSLTEGLYHLAPLFPSLWPATEHELISHHVVDSRVLAWFHLVFQVSHLVSLEGQHARCWRARKAICILTSDTLSKYLVKRALESVSAHVRGNAWYNNVTKCTREQ